MRVERPRRLKFGNALLMSAFACCLTGTTQCALADKAATALTLKIGYFNAGLVKASCPEGSESEFLKNQADRQLRQDVEDGNKRIQKAITDKKPVEEIAKLKEQLQIGLDAKQQALAQIVQTSNSLAGEKIAQAVNAVAKQKGLDLVIDGGGVYAGAEQVVEHGVDMTQEIVEKLKASQVKSATK